MRLALARVVIDTNVVFEGATQRGTAAAWVIEAWLTRIVEPYVSDTLAYEYFEVLSRKLSPDRWGRVAPLVRALLERSEVIVPRFSWRPSSPDPGDEHVIDCAMNAGAHLVTSNIRDFRQAELELGLSVMRPEELPPLVKEKLRNSVGWNRR